jgi:hypothetical protein
MTMSFHNFSSLSRKVPSVGKKTMVPVTMCPNLIATVLEALHHKVIEALVSSSS